MWHFKNWVEQRKLLQEHINYMFQQNTVSANEDNIYHCLDFEEVKIILKDGM